MPMITGFLLIMEKIKIQQSILTNEGRLRSCFVIGKFISESDKRWKNDLIQ